MGKDHYISLITKRLNSELSAAELKELNNWLSASTTNTSLVADFQDVWNSVATYKSSASFDADVAYRKFIKKYNIQPSTDVSAPITGGLSLFRLLIGAVTIAALILGASKLTKNLQNEVSNDALVSRTINLNAISTATLAPGTSMSFDKEDFEISDLKGQVYLDLDDKNSSLNLDFDDVKAFASGAALNLQNFDEENKFVADIEEGSVSFNINNEELRLNKGKRLTFYKKKKSTEVSNSTPAAFAWKKGILNWDNTPLDEVFVSLEKFYGVNINVVDDSNVSGHFTAINLKPSSLEECFELIITSFPMTIKRTGLKEIEISEIQSK